MGNNLLLSLIMVGTFAQRPTAPDLAYATTFGSGGVEGQANSNTGVFFFATDRNALYVYTAANGWRDVSALAGNVQTGLTASTTQTRAGALQMTGSYNNVTTVANSGDAVGLPDISYIGQQVMVTNAGANPMGVFPTSAANGANTSIDGGTAGAKVTVTNAKSALFTATTLTNWQSIGSAARAA